MKDSEGGWGCRERKVPPILLLPPAPPKQAQLFSCTHAHTLASAVLLGKGAKLIPMEIYLNEFPAWTLKLFPAWQPGRRDCGSPGHPNSHITATSQGVIAPLQTVNPAVLRHKPRFGQKIAPGLPGGHSCPAPKGQSREKRPVALAVPRRRSGGTAEQVALRPISRGIWSVR